MRWLPVALLLLVPVLVSSHGGGSSYETTLQGYKIDAGYSTPAPQVGETVLFDFRLSKNDAEAPFDDVWVKIESEDKSVVFAGGLHNLPASGPRMSYAFPRAGNYTVSFRYEKGTNPIVESSYPLTVLPSTPTTRPSVSLLNELWALGGFIAGGVVVALLRFKRESS